MKTTKKNFDSKKKLLTASTSLLISAAMLGTSTYAWFTMNKDVEVKGMKLQAQAEKGILINEKAGVSEGTWSETAYAGQPDPIALRPASTSDFSKWWHANSRKTNLEAGIGSGTGAVEDTNTVLLSSGTYYSDIYTGISQQTTGAENDTRAERTVYYADSTASGATAGYENGEGYYIKYTYYIKTSGNEALNVNAGSLKAAVTATKTAGTGSGTHSTELDKAIRVGIQVDGDSKATIFAPVNGADGSYKVTNNAGGSTSTPVTAITTTATGTATAATPINSSSVSLPAVTANGLAVYVYVWYEGEDTNCKSDNLAEVLDNYQIDIKFSDADLG